MKREDDSLFLVTKGALESALSRVSFIRVKDDISPVIEEDKDAIRKQNEEKAKKGRETILLVTKNFHGESLSKEDESNIVYEGIASFDALSKPSAKDMLDALCEYGVRIKVLTGEYATGSIAMMHAFGCEKVVAYSGEESSMGWIVSLF